VYDKIRRDVLEQGVLGEGRFYEAFYYTVYKGVSEDGSPWLLGPSNYRR
jgi:hypothetical protein